MRRGKSLINQNKSHRFHPLKLYTHIRARSKYFDNKRSYCVEKVLCEKRLLCAGDEYNIGVHVRLIRRKEMNRKILYRGIHPGAFEEYQ